jgi:hypothetical protein
MAYSATSPMGTHSTFQPRNEMSPPTGGLATEVSDRADLNAHIGTYRGFVLGMGLFAAHVLVILLLLYWILM